MIEALKAHFGYKLVLNDGAFRIAVQFGATTSNSGRFVNKNGNHGSKRAPTENRRNTILVWQEWLFCVL